MLTAFTRPRNPLALGALLGLMIGTALPANAEFFGDAKGKFSTSNIYFNRDFDNGTQRKEWGQSFILDWRSGFTDGAVGFGVDAFAGLGVKLDSAPNRTGTGLLPKQNNGYAANEFSRTYLTAKTKFSETELRYGSHIPKWPVISASTSRLLPQVFEGTQLQSKEIENVTFTAARFSRVIPRDARSSTDMVLVSSNKRYPDKSTADHLTLLGADWKITPKHTLRYWAADFQDIYRQHFLGFNGTFPVGTGSFNADVRIFSTKNSGKALAGEVDNRALSSLFTYKLGAQKFGLGWQRMFGNTGFAHLNGSDPYLINFVQVGNFGAAKERSWQARYDLDFSNLGVPGLSFMARYVQGKQARIPGTVNAQSESERGVELKYAIQDGPLKDLSFRVRNANYHADFDKNLNELRVMIDYSLAF